MNQKIKTNNIFSTCNGILMHGEQVVIPAVLTKKILKDFHTGHPRMSRMKALTRSYIYWLDMDKNIENMVKSCKSCASVAKAPPIGFKPWSHLYIDYASPIKGTYCFVIVDSFTKWPEIFKCKTPTTKTTIKVLQLPCHILFILSMAFHSYVWINFIHFSKNKYLGYMLKKKKKKKKKTSQEQQFNLICHFSCSPPFWSWAKLCEFINKTVLTWKNMVLHFTFHSQFQILPNRCIHSLP